MAGDKPRIAAALPTVGRTAELRDVAAALADAATGSAVLVGRPGVGTTHVARAAMADAVARGAKRCWVAATRAASAVPFGAFLDVLPRTPSTRRPGSTERLSLLRDVVAALEAHAADAPLVLGIDNAHLLDESSVAAVHHLATTRRAKVIAVVEAGAPVHDSIVALWKEGAARRVDVEPLGPGATADLAEAVLGGPLDSTTSRDLWSATEGYALLVEDVVAEGVRAGHLACVEGLWTSAGDLRPSRRLTEELDARLVDLRDGERQAAHAAVVVEPLGVQLFQRLVGAGALQRLERRRVIEVYRHERRLEVRVASPLHRVALRASTPWSVRRLVSRQLAPAVEATGLHRADDALRVARWRTDVNDTCRAEIAVAGARFAAQRSWAATAARLAGHAVDEGAGLPAVAVAAWAASRMNAFAEAERLLAGREEEVGTVDVSDARSYLVERERAVRATTGPAAAEDLLERASAWRPDSGWQAFVSARWALSGARDGHPGEALQRALRVLSTDGLDGPTARTATAAACEALAASGEALQAAALLDRLDDAGRATGPATGLPSDDVRIGVVAAALVGAGRLDDATDRLAQCHADALASGDAARTAEAAAALGHVAMARGQVVTATRWLVEATIALRRSDPGGHLRGALALLAQAAALAGDLDAARRASDEAAAARGQGPVADAELVLAEAYAARDPAELSRAAGDALAAADRHADRPLLRTRLLDGALRAGCPPTRVAGLLDDVATQLASGYVDALARRAGALARGDAPGMEDAATALEDLGFHLAAAETWAWAAALRRRAGREEPTRHAAARSAACRERCEGASTALLSQETGPLVRLTSREREVAVLAARGASNADIAERLSVSVRTVESHLYHLFAKLGVDRREELRPLVDGGDRAATA